MIMDDRPILTILRDQSHVETELSQSLRTQAISLIEPLERTPPDLSRLPETLLDLLSNIIKPLFSQSKPEKLTSTGRKNLVTNDPLPASVTRFAGLFDDKPQPAWKNGWTGALLRYILHSYNKIGDRVVRKKTIEAQFYLIVPAILHQLDDSDVTYKCSGCNCLKALSDLLTDVESTILRRSGLTDVFVDALKSDFSMIPTLTSEEESLRLFQAMYPAYRALVKARFVYTVKDKKEEAARQQCLTLLLRHQLLYSLTHLSTGSGSGATLSVQLSVFLISQIGPLFRDMGIASVIHLQDVLPLLRNVVSDPFATSTPELLLASIRTMQEIVQVCWPRIRDVWWGEVLRGSVSCYLNVIDEEEDTNVAARKQKYEQVKFEVRILTCLIEDVVGQPFKQSKEALLHEEPELKGLFDGDLSREPSKTQSISVEPSLITEL